ncbi:CDP-archaeol synthase [Candidatus Peribacteria bacterium]|nr:CDP-archaeol synthase [Candidatus Peribacteria bacterium]
MGTVIAETLFFILPAYAANMAPVLAKAMQLPGATPIHKQLFGSHKTWRGIWSGFTAALLLVWIQRTLQQYGIAEELRLLDYEHSNILLLAGMFGIGAIAGDMAKSAIKRYRGMPPGQPWFPFDELDFIAGSLVFLAPVYHLPAAHILALIIVTPILHALVNTAAYAMGFKKHIEP